ncbi:Uncharacterised protein g10169 [Pycnogonum litorale]
MSFSSGSDLLEGNKGDSELQEFLVLEQQKAEFQNQVHKLNDLCWDKCVDKAGNRLDSRTETCLSNCVERFIDTSLTIANRFAQLLQQQGSGHM